MSDERPWSDDTHPEEEGLPGTERENDGEAANSDRENEWGLYDPGIHGTETPRDEAHAEPPVADADTRHEGPSPLEDEHRLLFVLKDNLEAFAVAIIMALVIKHFCVEAFKIPTSSMEPTLMGDAGDRQGDRILVDKWAFLLRDPKRWEVPVFRYPLDRSRNFIKRIAGVGGEHLRIQDGDIWIKPLGSPAPFRQARKPLRVRNQLYHRFYPYLPMGPGDVPDALSTIWKQEGAQGAWRLADPQRFEFVGGEASDLVAAHPVERETRLGDWRRAHTGDARDLRITGRISIEVPAAGSSDAAPVPTRFETTWSPDGDYRATLRLSDQPGESEVRVMAGTRVIRSQALDFRLVPRKETDFQLEYVDGDVRLTLDGEELAVLADDRDIDEFAPSGGRQDLRFHAEGAPFVLSQIALDRDLWYQNIWNNNRWQREGVEIPEGNYLMLGDNTSNSSDSRRWRIRRLHLRDGRKIEYDGTGGGDAGPKRLYDPTGDWILDSYEVVDVEGVRRVYHEDDKDPDHGTMSHYAPFVWRELIVGRAFVVFWPLLPEFPGRLQFIH
jgi:signal peptidase I